MRASLKHEGLDSAQAIGVEVQDAVIWEQFGYIELPILMYHACHVSDLDNHPTWYA